MYALPLAPLPCESSEESVTFRRMDEEGFVDERVVSRVIARGAYERSHVEREDMVRSSSGEDYAGWSLLVASPFRIVSDKASATTRLPGTPALRKCAEPGMDAPYEGGHRWWLFGMSGALTCGIMALTIFGLASQNEGSRMPAAAPVTQQQKAPSVALVRPAPQPALTTVLPAER